MKRIEVYALIYLLLILSFSFNLGFYSLPGVIGVGLVIAVLFAIFWLGEGKVVGFIQGLEKWFAQRLNYQQIIYVNPWQALLITSVALSFLIEVFLYYQTPNYYLPVLLLFSLSVMTGFFILFQKEFEHKLFWLLLGLAATIKLLVILAYPNPAIDVFDQYLVSFTRLWYEF